MAIFIENKTTCVLCKLAIPTAEAAIAFPAFIPPGHEFSAYSDAVFHRECFEQWEDRNRYACLYEEYRQIWESRPRNLPYSEVEEWGKKAFSELFAPGMLQDGNMQKQN